MSFKYFVSKIEEYSVPRHLRLILSKHLPNVDYKDILFFPLCIITDISEWELVIEFIVSSGKKIIVYDWGSEGFTPGMLFFYSYIMKKLIDEHMYDEKNFIIIFGLPDIQQNHILYENLKTIFKYLPIPLYNSFWENIVKELSLPRETSHNSSFYKKILFLNCQPRLHRLAMISEIIDRNLWDDCILSFYTDSNDLGKFDCPENSLVLPNIKNRVDKNIDRIKPLLPLTVTLDDNDFKNNLRWKIKDIELAENTLFSLIGESSFYNNMALINKYDNLKFRCCYFYPCVFISEKTWRAIRTKHPFIVSSIPRFLEGLRELGYKTFHPYINESYDLIENEEERILAIMDEVERLCKMNDEETKKWLNSIQEITQYNYERLMNNAS